MQQSSVCPRRCRDRDKRLPWLAVSTWSLMMLQRWAQLIDQTEMDQDLALCCVCSLQCVCVCVCVCVLMVALTAAAWPFTVSPHWNFKLWENTVRPKQTAQTSLYRPCNTTSASASSSHVCPLRRRPHERTTKASLVHSWSSLRPVCRQVAESFYRSWEQIKLSRWWARRMRQSVQLSVRCVFKGSGWQR